MGGGTGGMRVGWSRNKGQRRASASGCWLGQPAGELGIAAVLVPDHDCKKYDKGACLGRPARLQPGLVPML